MKPLQKQEIIFTAKIVDASFLKNYKHPRALNVHLNIPCYNQQTLLQGCGVARSWRFLGGVGVDFLRTLGVGVQLNNFFS